MVRDERGTKEKVSGRSYATGSRVSSGLIAGCERRSWPSRPRPTTSRGPRSDISPPETSTSSVVGVADDGLGDHRIVSAQTTAVRDAAAPQCAGAHAKQVLALHVESCSPELLRLARPSASGDCGLSAGVLAAGPVSPSYSL